MANLTTTAVRKIRRRGTVVLSRKQWGSKEAATYRARRQLTRRGHWKGFVMKADTVVFHITVTFDTGKLLGDFKRDMQTVERIGKERFNSGFSYNFGIDMATGMAGVGQPLDSKGTHTINDKMNEGYSFDQNLKARAVAFVGMPGTPLSEEAVETAIDILVGMWEAGAITAGFDLKPHSFFTEKDCPTDAVRERMPEIERRAKVRIRRAIKARSMER